MMTSALSPTREPELLDAARAGSQDAFRSLVEPLRAELHAHCYRMLGSPHDADDALQDALLRAWRAIARFEGRSSLRSWLYRIATNSCLRTIERRPKRVLPVDLGPAADPGDPEEGPLAEETWIRPYPDERIGLQDGPAAPASRYEQRESVELAFVAALQHLPASQRAVLILRDVLGFSAAETAEALETTLASANSALQRARRTIDERRPRATQQATLRRLGDDAVRELVERYVDALERGDADALVAMLAEEASWSMPPLPCWYRGREAILGFLHSGPLHERWRHLPTRANGQLAVGCYRWDAERGSFAAAVLDVLTLDGERIEQVTGFVDARLFALFGLPDEIAAEPGRR